MKLSVVIICWNDRKVLPQCLASIYEHTRDVQFEVILSDNGSSDDSLRFVRQHYPSVRIVENNANLGYARGNNAGLPSQWMIYITVANLDRSMENCRNRGGKVISGPREMPGYGRYCVIQDPAGAVAALFEQS